MSSEPKSITEHSGNKYVRWIHDCRGGSVGCFVDVYSVLDCFVVTNPGLQHAIKKLLCAGIRGKGDTKQDLSEAIDAIQRAIVLHEQKDFLQKP